jgi:hypothetical protein
VSGSKRSLAEVGDPKEEWAARCSAESSGASFCDLQPSGQLLYNTVPSPSASVFRFSISFPPLFFPRPHHYGIVGLAPI